MRIVVVCPNLIGDTVMATPTIRALRAGFPDATITAVVRPAVSPTLDGAPWIDDRILSDHRSANRVHHLATVCRTLRTTRYDIAVLLPNSFRSAVLAWFGRIPRRVGYERGGRGPLLTDRLTPPRDANGRYLPVPIVEYYLALARELGCPVESTRPQLFTTESDRAAADAAFDQLGLSHRRPVVCLNTGGAFGPAKAWPETSFAELARRLVDERDASVLVICGPSERDAARRIVGLAARDRVVSLADQPLSIGLSKACIQRSDLLVTTDSGPRHFAGALGVPVVSLFGPTHIAWTRTYLPNAIHLQQPVPCGPCQQPVCPEGHHRCMLELTPDSVFRAALQLLGPNTARVPRPHLPIVTEVDRCPSG